MNYMTKLFFILVLMMAAIYFVGFTQGNIYNEKAIKLANDAIELSLIQQEIIKYYEATTKELLEVLQQIVNEKEQMQMYMQENDTRS